MLIDPDGRVVVSNAFGAASASSEALALAEVRRLGSVFDGPQAFGDIVGLASDGTAIYVSDRLAKEIIAFGPDGEVMRRIGRRGGGPGELPQRFPVGIHWQDPNRLWVGEPPSLFLFDSLGVSLVRPATLPLAWPWRGQADTLGSLYAEFIEIEPIDLRGELSVELRARHIVKHAPTMPEPDESLGAIAVTDTLSLPALPSPSLSVDRGNGRYEMRRLPMRPQILWAASPGGTVWTTNTAEYRLSEIAFSGDTVRTVELDRTPTQLGNRVRDSLAAASGFPVSEIPLHRPMMDRLDVAPDGWIWVGRRGGETLEWDVFDPCGRFVGAVSPPVRLDGHPIQVLRGGGLLAVTRNELDVQFVVRLQLERADGSEVRASSC